MPSFLIATTFLAQACGSGSTHGVNPEMQIRLDAAQRALHETYVALAPHQQIDPSTGRAGASFAEWSGITGPHVCWRPNASHHSAGSAIDIDAAANPYIATRNGPVPGGERGGESLVDVRNRALAVFDRAMQFTTPPVATADVQARQPGESTQAVWSRFKAVSNALASYLSLAVDPQPTHVARVALENADDLSDDELLATIPEGERLPFDRALGRLGDVLGEVAFKASHPRWPLDPRAQYLRMLRDYEQARIPMVIGIPSATPARTRNPARGFLHLRSEIAMALCDQGLRWGACDFRVRPDGSSQNGAMMHFDLADDGGYPEIHSLLRFG